MYTGFAQILSTNKNWRLSISILQYNKLMLIPQLSCYQVFAFANLTACSLHKYQFYHLCIYICTYVQPDWYETGTHIFVSRGLVVGSPGTSCNIVKIFNKGKSDWHLVLSFSVYTPSFSLCVCIYGNHIC